MFKLISCRQVHSRALVLLFMAARVDLWCEALLISIGVLGSVFRWYRLGPHTFGPDCDYPSADHYWIYRIYLVMHSGMFMAATTPIRFSTYVLIFFLTAILVGIWGALLSYAPVMIKRTEAHFSCYTTTLNSIRSLLPAAATPQAVEEWRDIYCFINEPMVHTHNGDCEWGSDAEYHMDGFYWLDICEAQPESVLFIRDEKSPNDMIPILKDADNRVCTICLEGHKDGDSVTVLPCGHAFGSGCLEPWMMESMTCPKCRRKFKWQLTSAD